jgi:hypothetical protein
MFLKGATAPDSTRRPSIGKSPRLFGGKSKAATDALIASHDLGDEAGDSGSDNGSSDPRGSDDDSSDSLEMYKPEWMRGPQRIRHRPLDERRNFGPRDEKLDFDESRLPSGIFRSWQIRKGPDTRPYFTKLRGADGRHQRVHHATVEEATQYHHALTGGAGAASNSVATEAEGIKLYTNARSASGYAGVTAIYRGGKVYKYNAKFNAKSVGNGDTAVEAAILYAKAANFAIADGGDRRGAFAGQRLNNRSWLSTNPDVVAANDGQLTVQRNPHSVITTAKLRSAPSNDQPEAQSVTAIVPLAEPAPATAETRMLMPPPPPRELGGPSASTQAAEGCTEELMVPVAGGFRAGTVLQEFGSGRLLVRFDDGTSGRVNAATAARARSLGYRRARTLERLSEVGPALPPSTEQAAVEAEEAAVRPPDVHTDEPSRKRRRGPDPPLVVGTRITETGTSDGTTTQFAGTVIESMSNDRYKVRFDDGDVAIRPKIRLTLLSLLCAPVSGSTTGTTGASTSNLAALAADIGRVGASATASTILFVSVAVILAASLVLCCLRLKCAYKTEQLLREEIQQLRVGICTWRAQYTATNKRLREAQRPATGTGQPPGITTVDTARTIFELDIAAATPAVVAASSDSEPDSEETPWKGWLGAEEHGHAWVIQRCWRRYYWLQHRWFEWEELCERAVERLGQSRAAASDIQDAWRNSRSRRQLLRNAAASSVARVWRKLLRDRRLPPTEKEGVAMDKEGVATEKEGVAMEKEGVAMEKEGVATAKEGGVMGKERVVSLLLTPLSGSCLDVSIAIACDRATDPVPPSPPTSPRQRPANLDSGTSGPMALPPGLSPIPGPHRPSLADARAAAAAAEAAATASRAIAAGTALLLPRQSRRSAGFTARRAAATAAETAQLIGRDASLHVLRQISRRSWVALSFCYRLMRRAAQSAAETLSRYSAPRLQCLEQPSSHSSLRLMIREEILTITPQPMPWDVGYDAEARVFSFRSPTGAITDEHPARGCTPGPIPAFEADGSIVEPLQPPADSSFALVPEIGGVWCYYDTALGTAQWHAPAGSVRMQTEMLSALPACGTFRGPPPKLHPLLTLSSLALYRDARWLPIFEDAHHECMLMHCLTGAVRSAPWVSLRSEHGELYFANLISRQTRWFPPRLWMEGWIMRASMDPFYGQQPHPLGFEMWRGHLRDVLPLDLGRLRVEGGAPYLGASGQPQYPPDEYDSCLTYPMAKQTQLQLHGCCTGVASRAHRPSGAEREQSRRTFLRSRFGG